MWSPIISTLITDRHDAVLVDPPIPSRAADVADWIGASGRTLRHIYITHGHGDHWFGAIPLLHRLPEVSVIAAEGTRRPNRINPGALWGAAITLLPPD